MMHSPEEKVVGDQDGVDDRQDQIHLPGDGEESGFESAKADQPRILGEQKAHSRSPIASDEFVAPDDNGDVDG